MPIKIVREDITRLRCDAIVNPTNESLIPGGGVDALIHQTAGAELLSACRALGGLSVGEAKATEAFRLPARFVIHTAGPVWRGGGNGETELLRSAYLSSLKLAESLDCKSVAFPLISSGTNGFPKEQVLRLALRAVEEFLLDCEMLVYIVVFDQSAYDISRRLYDSVSSFIDDTYAESVRPSCNYSILSSDCSSERSTLKRARLYEENRVSEQKTLAQMLAARDRGFAETLFAFIDERGLSDVECYKRANVDKKTFSKIKCNKDYKPSKVTAVSFAIALRLDLAETERLLRTVGMSLSHSNVFDIIIEYFVTTGDYESIYDVNETLFRFDQVTLGC